MNSRLKRLTRLALVALLSVTLLATASLAYAAPKQGRSSEDEHGMEGFSDADEATWAALYMEKMNLKGVVKGMPDGTFQPNAPVTHEQAVTMVLRVMGLEQEVQTRAQTQTQTQTQTQLQSNFSDASKISSWAQPYVAMAVEKGIVSWGQDGKFRANEPATRLEVAEMLVRALGLADQAAQQTGTLDFTDKASIPADKIGYILLAVDEGLVTGAPSANGKGYELQGNKPVTRAEMTAFMDREDGAMGELNEREVRGTVVSVAYGGTPSLTLTKKDGTTDTYEVAADARIFIQTKPGQLTDIQAGDQANLHLDENGVAFFVDIRYIDHVSGSVKAISTTSLTILPKSGEELTYSIAPDCKVVMQSGEDEGEDEEEGGTTGTTPVTPTTPTAPTLADIQVGDLVALELTRGVVTKIEVKELDEVSGTVTVVTAASGTTPGSITIEAEGGAALTYGVAAEVQVRFENQEQAANFTDIAVGDQVELKFQNRLVAEIKVKGLEEVSGTVTVVAAAYGTAPGSITIETEDGETLTYNVAAEVQIRFEEEEQATNFTDIVVGDKVELKFQNRLVAEIKVEKREGQSQPTLSLDGTVKSIDATAKSFVFTAQKDGTTVDYNVTTSDTTTFLKVGEPATFADLAVGQTVNVIGKVVPGGNLAAETVEIK